MIVWIVDDNPLHKYFLETILKEKEVIYKGFCSFKELREWLDRGSFKPPDLVLIDLHLGGDEKGEDVLKFLKETLGESKIKYIAFTADVEKKENLYKIGFDDVIYKPITREKMEKLLGDIINGYSRDKRRTK